MKLYDGGKKERILTVMPENVATTGKLPIKRKTARGKEEGKGRTVVVKGEESKGLINPF